eukprot:TRINITY_DN11535_c0_g1_i1.p1 TRINITY_DN11535_c0_g1~~TRINITY_DN11535_c0_g1_i1.p1  ORF type:complete len:574 (+),score=145.15 TRINITY_DN11535_c0_g1_i1:109-1830(+)
MEILRVGEHYSLENFIGNSPSGKLFSGRDIRNGREIRAKLEGNVRGIPSLIYEASAVKSLNDLDGFSSYEWYGKEGEFDCLVTKSNGPTLKTVLQNCGGNFTLKTICELANQMIKRIETLHESGFLHRNLDLDSFCIGEEGKAKKDRLYLVDLSSVRSLRELNGDHISYRENQEFEGNYVYSSINSHLKKRLSRRDDLESIGWILISLIKGRFPWDNFKESISPIEMERKIRDSKMDYSINMFDDIPEEFEKYMNYCRSLGFQEEPNYNYIKNLFIDLFFRMEFKKDGVWDWTNKISPLDNNIHPSPNIDQEPVRIKKEDCLESFFTHSRLESVLEDKRNFGEKRRGNERERNRQRSPIGRENRDRSPRRRGSLGRKSFTRSPLNRRPRSPRRHRNRSRSFSPRKRRQSMSPEKRRRGHNNEPLFKSRDRSTIISRRDKRGDEKLDKRFVTPPLSKDISKSPVGEPKIVKEGENLKVPENERETKPWATNNPELAERTIFIGYFPEGWSDTRMVWRELSQFGKVCYLKHVENFLFLTFEKNFSCERAIKFLNGTNALGVKRLRVEKFDQKKTK